MSSREARPPSEDKVLRSLFWKLFFRGRTTSRKRGEEGKLPKHGMWGILALYTLVGFFPLAAISRVDTITYAALLHGTTLFMVVFHMIATAGTVLFNKEEAEILLHRPVTSRALLRAKVTVLCGVASILAAALNLPGMIAGVMVKDAQWWFPLAHAVSSLCMIVFSAGALVVVYQACLRAFGRERLDNLMATLQTVLTVVLVIGSQAFRLLGNVNLQELMHAWWLLAMPPAWFASLDAALASHHPEAWMWLPAGFGLIATVFVAWLGFHKLAATYGEGLVMLNETTGTQPDGRQQGRRLQWILRFPPVRLWLRQPVERSAFVLAFAYMFRDRETKLRLFPGLGQVVAMPLAFLFMERTGDANGIGVALAGIYLGWLPLMALQTLAFSESWAASEIFSFTPEGRWQPLFHGTRKAVLVFLAVPMIAGLALLVMAIKGVGPQLLLLLPNILLVPVWSLVPALMEPWIPLSRPFDSKSQTKSGCFTLLIVMGVSAVISTLGWAAMKYGLLHWFLLLELIMAALVYAYLLGLIKRRS